MKKNYLIKLLFLIFSFLVVTQGNSLRIFAQLTDKDVEESEKRKTIAENEKAIAEAKKGKFDALFPKPDVSSLVGGTIINEGTFIETQMLGYCAMKRAVDEIVRPINSLPNKTNIVVYNEAEVKMQARYTMMMNRLKNLELSYQPEINNYIGLIQTVEPGYNLAQAQAEIAAAARTRSAGLIIDTALKFLSLLKTDVEITPADVAIGEKELVAEVFSKLTGYTKYYPQTIPLSIQNCAAVPPATCSPLLAQIVNTSDAHSLANYLKNISAKIISDKNRIISLNREIADPATPAADLLTLNAERVSILANYPSQAVLLAVPVVTATAIDNRVKILNTLFQLAMNELGFAEPKKETETNQEPPKPTACPDKICSQTTVNVNVSDTKKDKEESGGGGGSDKTFASYLQAESLKKIMDQANSRWIELKVIKAGGNMRVKSNIITNLMVGSRVNFSGGAIVSFNVFNSSGASETSGVISTYEGYRKSSSINDTCK